MTQMSLDREVARATGESLSTIRRMGFQVERPPLAVFDPDANADQLEVDKLDPAPAVVDWDQLAARRVAIFPCRYDRVAA